MPPTFPTFTNRKRAYDFLKMELDQRYNRAAATIKNTGTAAIALGTSLVGIPVKLNGAQWETVQNPNEAQATGFIVDDRASEAIAPAGISVQKYQILIRGPAIIDRSQLPATDVNGVAYVTNTLVTRLLAMSPPVENLVESTTVATQTT